MIIIIYNSTMGIYNITAYIFIVLVYTFVVKYIKINTKTFKPIIKKKYIKNLINYLILI